MYDLVLKLLNTHIHTHDVFLNYITKFFHHACMYKLRYTCLKDQMIYFVKCCILYYVNNSH